MRAQRPFSAAVRRLAEHPPQGEVTPPGAFAHGNPLPVALGRLSERQLDLSIMVVLVVIAAAVRMYSLQFCYVISTDGTGYVGAARTLAGGDVSGIGFSGFYPVLIWLAGLFITDLELAGRVVSIIAGTLMVIPLYLLGRGIFSRQVALCAGLLVTVWPPLVFYSCEVMTQASYICIQVSGIYLLWRMFSQPSATTGLLAGLCIGLAYLTRSEGLLLFLLPPLPYLYYHRRQLWAQRSVLAAYAAGFALFFALNLLLVHHVTGEWQISAKTDSALNDALSYYLKLPDLNYLPGYEPKGYLDIIREHPRFIWTNSLKNVRELINIFPLWFWALLGAGFFIGGFRGERGISRLFLLATLTPLGVIVVFYYIAGGYSEPYLPMFFLWGANGFCFATGMVTEKLTSSAKKDALVRRIPLAFLLTLVYAVAVFLPQVREVVSDAAYHPDMDQGRRSQKHIGLILKEHLPPGKIMTRWARVAFYAEREWVNIPAAVGFDKIIHHARENGVRFLVADGLLYDKRPGLGKEIFAPLDDPNIPYGKLTMSDPGIRIRGLKPCFLYTEPQCVGVVVYEIPPNP